MTPKSLLLNLRTCRRATPSSWCSPIKASRNRNCNTGRKKMSLGHWKNRVMFSNYRLLGALFLFLTACCAAQVSSVSGSVQDQAGAAVPNAQVTIINESAKYQRILFSNNSGEFVFSDVPIGSYRIIIVLAGFKKAIVEGVALAGQSNRISVELKT